MQIQNTYRNRILFAAVGFGVGGFLWGLEAYRGTVGAGESFTNPFSYILGAVALAVFGGLALAYTTDLNGSIPLSRFLLSRRTLKVIGLGLVGWLGAFFLPAVWVEWLFAIGGGLLSGIILTPFSFLSGSDLVQIVDIKPSLIVGHIWLEFFVVGAIISAVYSLIFKARIIKTVVWSAGGLALAAIIGPILGNLIGDLFGSLLVSYVVTFLIIGVTFGVSLVYGTAS